MLKILRPSFLFLSQGRHWRHLHLRAVHRHSDHLARRRNHQHRHHCGSAPHQPGVAQGDGDNECQRHTRGGTHQDVGGHLLRLRRLPHAYRYEGECDGLKSVGTKVM